METRLLSFDKIQYKRKTIDEGVILGSRPWRWTLGNKYSPCVAKLAENGLKLSALSPHKTNFQVYVSKHALEVGQALFIVNQDYQAERVETLMEVAEIGANYCKVNVLAETKTPVQKEIQLASEAYVETFNATAAGDMWFLPEDNQREHVIDVAEPTDDQLLAMFGNLGAEQPEEEHTERPCEPTRQGYPQGQGEVSEVVTSSTSQGRMRMNGNFVKGKQQDGFMFAMPNAGKYQMTLLAAKPAAQPEPQQPQPRRTIAPVNVAPQPQPTAQIVGFTPAEIAILDVIRKGAKFHIDEIIQQAQMPAGQVAGLLLMLEMAGHIKQERGHKFSRA
jgi:hypothetical protein